MRRVPIHSASGVAAFALVDDAEFNEISSHRWHLRDRYAVRRLARDATGRRPLQSMHRQILGLAPGDPLVGHHKNRNRLDNRRANLESLTPGEHALTRHLPVLEEIAA